MINIGKFFFIALVITAFGCNGCGEKREVTEHDIAKAQERLIKESKKIHEKEIKEIDKYIHERKWPMQQTTTGLRYWIYQVTDMLRPLDEDIVSISYSISLLDGALCYETTDANPKYVRIGRDNVETGLHEALKLMRAGEKAKFIFPSHLAFGFTGDSNKIPPNASVVYDIHLLSIQ